MISTTTILAIGAVSNSSVETYSEGRGTYSKHSLNTPKFELCIASSKKSQASLCFFGKLQGVLRQQNKQLMGYVVPHVDV